ncbi:uncharacterized protein DC041_0005470 [Schistosoma bovis]|uniref:PH domain-containing protein n=1 Tax=Schistosoma bovis TaxID=6184 RepID=A0A430Q8A1_SCHBO|nr:uncharacterized protein DC041_0005470 [Schistosoma bovis]
MSTAEPFAGWLYKWTNLIKGYKKRWFLVQDNLLSYYREPDAVGRHCRGTFDLTNAHLSVQESGCSFILTESSGRKHHFKALSEEDKENWIIALSDLISRSQVTHTEIESDYSSFNILRPDKENSCRPKLDIKTTSFPVLPQPLANQSISLNNCQCDNQSCSHDGLCNSTFSQKFRRIKLKHDLSKSDSRCVSDAPVSNSFSLPVHEPNVPTNDLKIKSDTGRPLTRQYVISIEDSNRLGIIEALKRRLHDHISNICSQASTEALQFLTRTYARFNRQLVLEQERCITLERTVEQLAKELRSLEIQLKYHIPMVVEDKNMSQIQSEGTNFFTLFGLVNLISCCFSEVYYNAVAAEQSIHLTFNFSHSNQSDGYPNTYNKNSTTDQHNNTLKYGKIRKRRNTIPVSPKIALNLWGIIKNAIGKDLAKIPIPVNFNEPLSFLQRAVEDFTYSNLLDYASQTRDPVEQMAYVVAFSVSCYSSTAYRVGKPFNSLLGETYECDRTDDMGWRCISEQV